MAGWWDIFMSPQLLAYDCYQNHGGTLGKNNAFLVVLPTGHCAQGIAPWPKADGDAGLGAAGDIAVALFQAVKDGNTITTDPTVPHIAWYVMMGDLSGTSGPGNYWTAGTSFPQYQKDIWYLTSTGTLTQSGPSPTDANLGFTYDPNNPTSTIGGSNLLLPQCGPWPQNPTESRKDVLLFTSPPLPDHYYITGPLIATLFVSSSAKDTDFVIRLTDVFSNGTSLLVQDGITRMRWREGLTGVPQWITPGEVYSITVSLWNTSYVFAKGHSIRVSVTSSNSPRFLPNLNNGDLIIQNGTAVTVQNVVYVGGKNGNSFITLPKVSSSSLPPVNITDWTKNAIASIKISDPLY